MVRNVVSTPQSFIRYELISNSLWNHDGFRGCWSHASWRFAVQYGLHRRYYRNLRWRGRDCVLHVIVATFFKWMGRIHSKIGKTSDLRTSFSLTYRAV
jgi:hypothetical protein